MIGHDFPYLETRDLNLDWIIKTIKKLVADWAAQSEEYNNRFDTLKSAFEDLKNYVTSVINDISIQELINNKMDELFQSGALAYLLSVYTFINNSTYYTTHYGEKVSDYFIQGGTFISGSTIVYAMDNNADETVLVKMDFKSGEVIQQLVIDELKHYNDLERIGDYIYCAYNQNIDVYDLTLNFVETYTFNFNVIGITYNRDTEKFIVTNGNAKSLKFYIGDSLDAMTLAATVTDEYANGSGTQGIIYFRNTYILLSYGYSCLMVYDAITYTLLKTIAINKVNQLNQIIAEYEFITLIDDEHICAGSNTGLVDGKRMHSFEEINLIQNEREALERFVPTAATGLYVDSRTSLYKCAGTSAAPYSHIGQTLLSDLSFQLRIILADAQSYGDVELFRINAEFLNNKITFESLRIEDCILWFSEVESGSYTIRYSTVSTNYIRGTGNNIITYSVINVNEFNIQAEIGHSTINARVFNPYIVVDNNSVYNYTKLYLAGVDAPLNLPAYMADKSIHIGIDINYNDRERRYNIVYALKPGNTYVPIIGLGPNPDAFFMVIIIINYTAGTGITIDNAFFYTLAGYLDNNKSRITLNVLS